MLKEMLYTGVGGALLLKERVEEEIRHLEENGKLSRDEGRQFFDKLQEKGEAEEQRVRDEMKRMIKEVIDELGLATKEDIENLKSDLK